MSGRAREATLALVRVLLGALFVYAAATKVGDMGQFAEEVANYQLLPPSLVPLVAAALPGIEILAGALLIADIGARGAALVVAGMLLAFTVGLAQALGRGVDLRCGCFGGSEIATWWTVARDVALLAMATLVLWLGGGRVLPRRAA